MRSDLESPLEMCFGAVMSSNARQLGEISLAVLLFSISLGFACADDSPLSQDEIPLTAAAHGPLLERQAKLPPEIGKDAAAIVASVLAPDLIGVTTRIELRYDQLENPAEVTVTLEEGGILDDDLLGRRHLVELARNRNGDWRVIGYRVGERRR